MAATTALLPVLSPPDAYHDQWDVLVLSAPFGSDTLHGTPPPDKLLKRMVDPVSKSNDPNAGGLGISASHYMQTAKQYGYQGDRLGNDDKCSWSLPPAA